MARALLPLLLCAAAVAAPRRPAADEDVIARFPASAHTPAIASLRAASLRDPSDLQAAQRLARSYIAAGRAQDDPRQMSYALATLKPWLERETAPPEALVLAATAAQYVHQFDPAMAYLERALAQHPDDAEGQLMRANLLEVRGDLDGARAACAHLARITAQEIAVACLSSVASRSGRLQSSYDNLRAMHSASQNLPADVDVWMTGILADMAQRLGRFEDQAAHIAAARERAPQDLKLKASQADWLLARKRPRDVLDLLRDDAMHDALLLRLALAARATGAEPQLAARYASAFRGRQAMAAGESRHLREHARFLLDVDDDPVVALRLALDNWRIQREPEDVRLLVRASRRAGNRDAEAIARTWIAEHHYEDVLLE